MTRSTVLLCLIILGLLSCLHGSATAAGAGVMLQLLSLAEKSYAGVTDYTSIFVSRERIGGTLREAETIQLKFQRPFRVYMKWLEGPSKGREGLYVAGANDGKFLIYEPRGVRKLFTAALDPQDPRVMEQSRHPVTDVGLGRLLEIVGENARRGMRAGVMQVIDRGLAQVGGQRVRRVEGILPRDPKAGYYCYRVFLAFDEENHLPIQIVVYDWNDEIVEEYTHTQLRVNPGLTDRDFDPNNREYGFSGWRIPVPG